MAITNFAILNPADKVRHISFSSGTGAPAATDPLVTDIKTHPIGSQYTDTENKILYIRTAANKAVADWTVTTPTE